MALVDLKELELRHTIGRGAFGYVKYARYKKDGKYYAVKRLEKHQIIQLQQVDHIQNEKLVLAQMEHPFIVNLLGYAKDSFYVYLMLECVSGGELFHHLRRARKFTNEVAKFYSAQTAAAFAYIHSKNIIHRDLKPENILICQDGYAKLSDFGFSKQLEPGISRTYTLCGTPEYIAPEVLLYKVPSWQFQNFGLGRALLRAHLYFKAKKNEGHGKPVDWWTLGILIYEMIVGQPPFCDDDPMGIYMQILAGQVYFPKYFDKSARWLVKKLLTADLTKRFGNLKDGANDILNSKWLETIDFEKLAKREIPSPFRPSRRDASDPSTFKEYPEPKRPPAVEGAEDPFSGWD